MNGDLLSTGYYPQDQPCAFCRRPVNEVDATWYEGMPYHENHFKLFLANELRYFEKKKQLGTLTLAEAQRMADIQEMYDIERKSPASAKLSKCIFTETPVFKGNTRLSMSHMPRKQLNSSQENVRICENKIPLISSGKDENSQPPDTPQK